MLHHRPARARERGSVLVTVIIFVVVLAGLGSSMLRVDLSISNSRRAETAAQMAYFAAEAGIDEAFVLLRSSAPRRPAPLQRAFAAPLKHQSRWSPPSSNR